MIKQLGSLVVLSSLFVMAGCGGQPEPAKSTPEVPKEAQQSMERAATGGGGPEMIRKMQEQGKTKPD